MKYLPLFNLLLAHDYYASKNCNDFIIEPCLQTQALLVSHRCVVKFLPHGVKVWIQASDQRTPFIDLPIGTVFQFNLRLRNSVFFRFTDTNPDTGAAVMRLSDPALKFNSAEPMVIAEQDIFGCVSITIDNTLTALTDNAKEFRIEFAAKKYLWRYYIVVNNETSLPSIEDKNQIIVFDQPNLINLTKMADLSDKLGFRIIQQYPNLQVFRLLSTVPISCQEASSKTLQLKINGERVIDFLLSPPIHNYVFDEANSIKESLYFKVKYFTQ